MSPSRPNTQFNDMENGNGYTYGAARTRISYKSMRGKNKRDIFDHCELITQLNECVCCVPDELTLNRINRKNTFDCFCMANSRLGFLWLTASSHTSSYTKLIGCTFNCPL